MITNVIERTVLRHRCTGRQVIRYGPFSESPPSSTWEVAYRGYTWQHDDGSIGLGRLPVATYAKAAAIMEAANMVTPTACPDCNGTGADLNHTWGNGDLPKPGMEDVRAACESCGGYGDFRS